MRKVIQAIKSVKIRQVLTVFLAGCLLVISTACSQSDVAKSNDGLTKRETSRTYQGEARDTYDNYDANQNYEGGMNGFNDDRRYDSGTAAKAKALVDKANRRQADDLGDVVDNVKDGVDINKADRALNKFSNKVERNKDKALDYLDDKSDKLQRNLGKVPEGAENVFDEATDTAQDALNDATKAAQKNTKNIKSNFEDLS